MEDQSSEYNYKVRASRVKEIYTCSLNIPNIPQDNRNLKLLKVLNIFHVITKTQTQVNGFLSPPFAVALLRTAIRESVQPSVSKKLYGQNSFPGLVSVRPAQPYSIYSAGFKDGWPSLKTPFG
jgi:hypothetical protein